MTRHAPQVGAPDPEKKISPILNEDEAFSFDLELESGAGYFSGAAYPIGRYVRSGTELLRCEERALWVRRGELED